MPAPFSLGGTSNAHTFSSTFDSPVQQVDHIIHSPRCISIMEGREHAIKLDPATNRIKKEGGAEIRLSSIPLAPSSASVKPKAENKHSKKSLLPVRFLFRFSLPSFSRAAAAPIVLSRSTYIIRIYGKLMCVCTHSCHHLSIVQQRAERRREEDGITIMEPFPFGVDT